MSSNRLLYDPCAYNQDIFESTKPLSYVLNTQKYQHCKPCRMALGVVGGNEVSPITGNLVDLENELRGQTRLNTNCPALQYNPANTQDTMMLLGPRPSGFEQTKISIEKSHLPTCQLFNFPSIPLPPPPQLTPCPPSKRS